MKKTSHGSSHVQDEARQKGRDQRAKIAGPIARIESLGARDVTVDRAAVVHPVIARAFDAQDQPVPYQMIYFHVLDAEATGTTFYLGDIDFPVDNSAGATDPGGYCVPSATLRSGDVPGSVIVRATSPGSVGDDVHADFNIRVSSVIPSELIVLEGDEQGFPAGSLVTFVAAVQLLDADGAPVVYGGLRFHVEDPNGTGSVFVSGGYVVAYHVQSVDGHGVARCVIDLLVGDKAPGSTFHVRVSRDGREPIRDIECTALPS